MPVEQWNWMNYNFMWKYKWLTNNAEKSQDPIMQISLIGKNKYLKNVFLSNKNIKQKSDYIKGGMVASQRQRGGWLGGNRVEGVAMC